MEPAATNDLVLSIAMPAFNEERGIERAVREALAALDALASPGEVVVIDDGSTDATPAILARLAEADPRLRVVRTEKNSGIASFNRKMIQNARGTWVFFIGADGEWDCLEAVRFLEIAARERVDAVLGYRIDKRYGFARSVVSSAFNLLVFLFFGARFRDIGSIRLLRRDLFAPLPLYSRSAFINAERLLVGRRRGATFQQVPVKHRERLSGTGRGASFRNVARSVRDLIRTRLRWFAFERYYA